MSQYVYELVKLGEDEDEEDILKSGAEAEDERSSENRLFILDAIHQHEIFQLTIRQETILVFM